MVLQNVRFYQDVVLPGSIDLIGMAVDDMTNQSVYEAFQDSAPPNAISRGSSGEGWQLQTAKVRFSEVIRLARTESPQRITPQGKDGVVMLPVEHFDRLVVRSREPISPVQFFRESPTVGLELDLERDQGYRARYL